MLSEASDPKTEQIGLAGQIGQAFPWQSACFILTREHN
jgi:hypothetical protein